MADPPPPPDPIMAAAGDGDSGGGGGGSSSSSSSNEAFVASAPAEPEPLAAEEAGAEVQQLRADLARKDAELVALQVCMYLMDGTVEAECSEVRCGGVGWMDGWMAPLTDRWPYMHVARLHGCTPPSLRACSTR